MSNENLEVKNYMEECVRNSMDTIIKNTGVCDCDMCKLDILALSLNSMHPKYVVSQKGIIFTKMENLEQQFTADLISTITKACEMVKEKPRHPKYD